MSRWQHLLIAALALLLLAGCIPILQPAGGGNGSPLQTQEPAQVPVTCPTQASGPAPAPCLCPTCKESLHVVSLYSTLESPGEEEAALRDYAIVAQEFSAKHIQATAPLSGTAFSLITAPPVAALGRKVDNLTKPGPLPAQDEVVPWRLYVRGGNDRSIITCSTETGLYWQEVFAILNPTEAGQNVYAYNEPVLEICLMPTNTSTQDMAKHARTNQVWIDTAVFDLGNDRFGLYRFGPKDPEDPGGPRACQAVCAPIRCRSAIGCFVYRVCRTVCR